MRSIVLVVALLFSLTAFSADTTVSYDRKSDFGVQASYWRVQSFHVDIRTGICQVYLAGFPSAKEAGDDVVPLAVKTVNVLLPAKVFADSLSALQSAAQQQLDDGN